MVGRRLVLSLRSSRVIGDFGGYRRLFAYLAPFGREGVGRQPTVWRKGGLYRPLKVSLDTVSCIMLYPRALFI